MAVYSPSSTLAFMTCPTLWWLKNHEGWRPKRLANPELAAAVGIGISAGMEAYFTTDDLWPDERVKKAVLVGQQAADGFLQERLDMGAIVHPHNESTLQNVLPRVGKVIEGFHKKSPFPADWHTFLPELTFPDHGRSRADLLCQTELGPCIVDFKSKVTVGRAQIVDDFLFDFETSWQMQHYMWAARQMGIDVVSYAVCLVVIEPLRFYVQQWALDVESLIRWTQDAYYWWEQMDMIAAMAEEGIRPPRIGDHRTKYGLCEMYDACFTLPEGAWHQQYSQRVKVTEGV